jgi:hypothetical protein
MGQQVRPALFSTLSRLIRLAQCSLKEQYIFHVAYDLGKDWEALVYNRILPFTCEGTDRRGDYVLGK